MYMQGLYCALKFLHRLLPLRTQLKDTQDMSVYRQCPCVLTCKRDQRAHVHTLKRVLSLAEPKESVCMRASS